MKRILRISYLILAAFIINIATLSAQTSHAHAASQLWKGIDIESTLSNMANNSDSAIYLYNVGTGMFAIGGGTWGMEARLFYEDFGLQMDLRKLGSYVQRFKIYTHITEENISADKQYLIANLVRLAQNGWTRVPDYSYTTIMDGQASAPEWQFTRVPTEDANSETHTYYLYQKYNNSYTKSKDLNVYLGAAYGEWCPDGTTTYNDNTTNNKGNGFYVHIDDDRSVWTTAGQEGRYHGENEIAPYNNTTKVLVNGDSVTIQELYQWRIISQAEFEEVLLSTVQGINPSVSSLIPDRDFTRNADNFYNDWVVSPASTTPNDTARKAVTWGNIVKGKPNTKKGESGLHKMNGTDSTAYYYDQAWNAPVRLKKVFDDAKNAKYGFMSFEGVGTVSTTFKVPQPGWYQIESAAFCFAPNDHKTYMFAHTGWEHTDAQKESDMHAYMGYGEAELYHYSDLSELATEYNGLVSFPTGSSLDKNNENTNRAVGEVLTRYPDNHKQKFWIYVNPDSFNLNDQYKTITIGYGKEKATPQYVEKKNNIKWYYDADWIAIDNIMMSYMGLAPAFLYEDENTLEYLVYDENLVNERPGASPDSLYRGALSLSRTMKQNQWNSFSLPIPITGEQVRMAFGEDAHLVELVSVGSMSQNKNVIDFRTVNLKNANPLTPVIIPGKFYLLKPTINPVEGEDPLGVVRKYYSLGRNFFSVKPLSGSDTTYYELDVNTLYETQSISSVDGSNDGTSYVSYVMTPNFSTFAIDGNGLNTVNAPTGLFVPKGGYAVSNGTIYELNRDTPIKGFRGWIVLSHSIFDDDPSSSPSLIISIDGEYKDKEVTDIAEKILAPIDLRSDTSVYDLMGRKVGTIGDHLPKGIYIVRGKKFYVK